MNKIHATLVGHVTNDLLTLEEFLLRLPSRSSADAPRAKQKQAFGWHLCRLTLQVHTQNHADRQDRPEKHVAFHTHPVILNNIFSTLIIDDKNPK